MFPIQRSVPLVATKTSSFVGFLVYREDNLSNSQRRFVGRYALRPVIDLKQFTCRAVIDWIQIGVLLERKTQFQWIQREIENLFGAKPYVRSARGDANAPADEFDIRIQDPDISIVLKAMEVIRGKFGLALDPIVRSIEISLDFKPRGPSELERARMSRVLMNHIFPSRDVISNVRDRPRAVWGRGGGHTARLLYDLAGQSAELNKRFLVEVDRDTAPYTDSTLQIGERYAPATWRVMDKVIDHQDPVAGTFTALDDSSKRARIEVTLNRPDVAALGVDYLDDLQKLNFAKLQGSYFRFFLPTFVKPSSLKPGKIQAIAIWRDRERATKFLKTGVIGLKAMDDVRAEDWNAMRRRILPHLHRAGKRLSVANRAGKGTTGTLVAYKELNDRANVALGSLGDRVRASFSRGP